jgi:hypothetical protein
MAHEVGELRPAAGAVAVPKAYQTAGAFGSPIACPVTVRPSITGAKAFSRPVCATPSGPMARPTGTGGPFHRAE